MTVSTTSEPSVITDSKPIFNENKGVRDLYEAWESRIGYAVVLGNTRHFGYWDKDTYMVFPLSGPLRRMESKLFDALNLPTDSQVLDAGCGVGHVALYMAKRGLKVTAIDVTDHHLAKARRNITRAGKEMSSRISVTKMDFHHLESIKSNSHDGVYTMETFVHATDPEQVAQQFYRVLRPGGRLALHEYDLNYEKDDELAENLQTLKRNIELYGAMPTWERAKRGFYKKLLEDAGFVDVEIKDYSENIWPMLRLFWLMAFIPAFFIKRLHLEKYFISAICADGAYRAKKYWRRVEITARKPDNDTPSNAEK